MDPSGSARPAFAALIGDLRGSREMAHPERARLQDRLEHELERLNEIHADAIAARLTVTLGDEFQGLFLEPGTALQVALSLTYALAPAPVAYGIGWGELTTAIKEQAFRFDGVCYHRARDSLTKAKDGGAWINVSGFGERSDRTANAFLPLLQVIRSEWTSRQWEYVVAAREAGSRKDVAQRLGVSPPSVTQALQATHFDAVQVAEAAIVHVLPTRHELSPAGAQGRDNQETPEDAP